MWNLLGKSSGSVALDGNTTTRESGASIIFYHEALRKPWFITANPSALVMSENSGERKKLHAPNFMEENRQLIWVLHFQ